MFKSIPKSNVSIRPFKAYKSYIFTDAEIKADIVRNLTGSFDQYENDVLSGSGNFYNEYSFNKSIRTLFYNNHPKLVGNVINWDFGKHSNKHQYIYQVSSSLGLSTYSYYFNTGSNSYVDEFSNWLNQNNYQVNSSGSVFSGTYTNVVTMYGNMYNYAALDERLIGDRYYVLQIPQLYIGEGINPSSLSIFDNYTGKEFIDDGYGNITYSDNLDLVVGNIFYANGIITITYKTENIAEENYYFGSTGYQIQYESTKTIYENEIFVEVSQNEFNISTNPSATVNYNGATYVKSLIPPKISGLGNGYDFRIVSKYNGVSKIGFNDYEFSSSIDPTGSYLAPYVTTIGLYDDEFQLVAVAKIPSKPKSAPDYPINFIVRFDT